MNSNNLFMQLNAQYLNDVKLCNIKLLNKYLVLLFYSIVNFRFWMWLRNYLFY